MAPWLLLLLPALAALTGAVTILLRRRAERRAAAEARAFEKNLADRLQRQTSDLAGLMATLADLADAQQDGAILTRACDDAVRLIPGTRAAVLAVRADGALAVAATSGFPPEAVDGLVLRSLTDATTVLAAAMDTRGAHATPLATRHEQIGVLVVGRAREEGLGGADACDDTLSPTEQSQLQVIADFAARTAQDARLQRHLERQVSVPDARPTERAQLLDQLARAEQKERRRLIDLLHDGPQQTITSVSLMLDASLDAASDGDWEAMRQMVSRARDRNRESIRDLRELGSSMVPQALPEVGLAAALEPLVARLADDHGVTLLVEFSAAEGLPAALQTMMYPIVREALANSLKHARASQITVAAERLEDGIAVVVADNGSGMLRTVAQDGLGQGTARMRERATAIGATVSWEPVPGGGTALRLVIPAEVLLRAA